MTAPEQMRADHQAVARILYDWEIGRGVDFPFDEAPTAIRDRCNHLADKVLAALRNAGAAS